MLHITPEGPKRCRAEIRQCPLGGEHYESMAEAEKAFAQMFSYEVHQTRKKVSKKLEIQHTEVDIQKAPIGQKKIVLSDVDGTLLRGSLANDHAVWLHEHGIVDLGDIPDRWRADPKNEELIRELAVANIQAIAGKTLAQLRVREFMEETMKEDGKFYSSLQKLIQAREQGSDVVLISGSPQYLIGDFAKRFGFEGVGSRYHRDRSRKFNGRITGMFNAQAKTAAVNRLQIERYDLVEAYGDTISDKPLLEVAQHSVLVDPTDETLAAYERVDEVLRS